MTKLLAALREKYPDPRAALRALGLDENLARDALSTERDQMAKPTRLANTALQLTTAMIRPLMAKDAKFPDLMPIFKDVNTKTFDAKKITMALDAAFKGKLAKDAEPHMGHVAQLMDHLGGAMKPETADESVSEPQHKAMEAAAHGESELGIPAAVGKEFTSKDEASEGAAKFLREKGMTEDDIGAVMDMMFQKKGAADESPEEKAKREAEEKKKAEDKKAADEKMADEKRAADEKTAKDAEAMKNMVDKPAMDAAIDAAVKATEKRVVATQRGIRMALDEVKPYVGKLADSIAFDSADDVYRHALTMRNVKDAKTLPAAALPTILHLLPKVGAQPVAIAQDQMAMDEAGTADLNKMFPGIDLIESA